MSAEVTVIGGGISGMLSAYYLNKAGLKVEIFEKGGVGRESSWAGGGILSPLYPWRYPEPVSELADWSQQKYPELSTELFAATGIDPEYLKSGFLLLDVDDVDVAINWAQKYQAKLEVVNTQTITKLEPALKDKFSFALWMSEVAQVRNPKLLKALTSYLKRAGVKISERTEVVELLANDNKIDAVKTNSGKMKIKQLVITGGAWTSKILDNIKANVNISPVRGQMIMFKTPPGTIKRISILDQHYLIPRKDGRVLFGSTLEQAGFDKSTSTQVCERLKALACDIAPVLESMPIERHWAGLRPGSEKGIPYISQHPEFSNLFVNAGHFRNGVVLGPASAKLLSQIITQDKLILDPRPYVIK